MKAIIYPAHSFLMEEFIPIRGSDLVSTMEEHQDCFSLTVNVPGMTRKDLVLHIEDRAIVIRKKNYLGAKGNPSMWSEDFYHSYMPPQRANTDRIKAKCKNGVLTIRIEKLKSRRALIKVRGNEDAKTTGRFLSWWKTTKQKLQSLDIFGARTVSLPEWPASR